MKNYPYFYKNSMKLKGSSLFTAHTLILSFVLAISVSSTAEESNIWDDFLGFFSSGGHQGKECDEGIVSQELAEQIRSEVCPHFLMKQVMNRDQKTMIFSNTSAEKLCYENANRRDDHVFKTPQELENHLRTKEPFSKINTVPTADCLSGSFSTGSGRNRREKTLPEDKKKTVLAEYYLTQQRLESGMSGVLQDITAIDQLIGRPPLNKINCRKFQLTSNILEECQSLQKCSSSESSLKPLAAETKEAMRAVQAIDEEIDKLDGPRGRHAQRNAVQIQELRERKAGLQSLYPWTVGKIFLDKYDENSSEEKTAQLIKEQLFYTRKRLEKNISEMQGAVSCIRYNRRCKEVEYDKVMAKTPLLSYEDVDSIFQVGKKSKTKSMNESELSSLSDEERKKLSEKMNINNTAASYVIEAQCRQTAREDVSEARKELGFLALDVGLTIATVGLGSAAIAGRLVLRAGGQISKAQRLQNLGLMGVDIAFSAPYIDKAIDDCDDYMNQLEHIAGKETNDICKKLPVRSKLTSDLKSCLLTASLASLPLAVPAFAVAGRAGFKAFKNSTPPPSAPTNPTPSPSPPPTNSTSSVQPAPLERQLAGPPVNSNTPAAAKKQLTTQETPRASVESRAVARTSSQPNPKADLRLLSTPKPKQAGVQALTKPSLPAAKKTKSSLKNTQRTRRSAQRNRETVNSRTRASSSSSKRNSQRTSRPFFQTLKDAENRAQGLARKIRQIIIGNNIGKASKHSLGDYLHSASNHLRQQNPGMNEAQISQIIAQELKKQGANIEYAKGLFKIKNNEGVFVVDSSGKMRKITENPSSSNFAGRQRVQSKPTTTARHGAVVLRSNNLPSNKIASRTGRQTGRSIISRGSKPGQKIAETTGRVARSTNRASKPNNTLARNIQTGIAGRTIGQGMIGGAAAGSTSAATAAVADNASSENLNNANGGADPSEDGEGNSRKDDDRDNYEDEDEDNNKEKDKKQNLDCSEYKGGSPQNRREMICYYYMKTQQLTAETQNIQKNTQTLNNFKSQVWLGVKEDQVPPSFFTNIQKNIQKSKTVTADYLNNFRLMYDISRIQNQYLNPNDQNRLRLILQETDQYMNSANLDGYSHIQESVNILMNRLQIPSGPPLFRL